MTTYDYIIVGGGITGSALAYELVKLGVRVLLLEKDVQPNNATVYSYGGLAYWSGTTPWTRQICQQGISLYHSLADELQADIEFRPIDLLLTLDKNDEQSKLREFYSQLAIAPEYLTVEQAWAIEPLLNPEAISGAFKLPHAQINPQKTNEAYQKAFTNIGGEIKYETVIQPLVTETQVQGVITRENSYYSKNTIIAAGGLSRSLLQTIGVDIDLYFTHAQVIITAPIEIVKMRTIVMPANQKRAYLEVAVSQNKQPEIWQNQSDQLVNSILDVGAIQFQDGRFFLGQISEIIPNPQRFTDTLAGETKIRAGIAQILPKLKDLPGTCYHCLVAFAPNNSPLIGQIADYSGLYLFSGFTSTLLYAPPLARQFARCLVEEI